jgi:hypothetical protein
MQIFTYSVVGEAPAGQTHVARILHTLTGPKGKPLLEWHPVIFAAGSEEAVRTQAQDWWDAELAKVEAKRAAGLRLAQSRQTKTA